MESEEQDGTAVRAGLDVIIKVVYTKIRESWNKLDAGVSWKDEMRRLGDDSVVTVKPEDEVQLDVVVNEVSRNHRQSVAARPVPPDWYKPEMWGARHPSSLDPLQVWVQRMLEKNLFWNSEESYRFYMEVIHANAISTMKELQMYLDPRLVPRRQLVAWRSDGSQNPMTGPYQYQQLKPKDEAPIKMLHHLASLEVKYGWV